MLRTFEEGLKITEKRLKDEKLYAILKKADMGKQPFSDNFFDLSIEKDYAKSSWHLYPIRLKNKYKEKKKEIFEKLREKSLGVQVHYIPVYWQPYYQKLGYKKGICPIAEDFYQREISIPLYQSMSDEDVKYIVNVITETFGGI